MILLKGTTRLVKGDSKSTFSDIKLTNDSNDHLDIVIDEMYLKKSFIAPICLKIPAKTICGINIRGSDEIANSIWLDIEDISNPIPPDIKDVSNNIKNRLVRSAGITGINKNKTSKKRIICIKEIKNNVINFDVT